MKTFKVILAITGIISHSAIYADETVEKTDKIEKKERVIKSEELIKKLSIKYTPPPAGARGISVVKAPSIAITIFFKPDTTEIADEDSILQIKEVAKALNSEQLKNYKFDIEGHCDSDGEREYNLKLSQQRAEKIRNLLITTLKVSSDQVVPIGKGEDFPIASNDTDEGKQANRRVVFVRKN